MALGMRDPSYWGPQQQFRDVEKKTITPTRIWDVKSSLAGRSLGIEQNGTVLYDSKPEAKVFKDPAVAIHRKGEQTVAAGARLDGKDKSTFSIYLGNPTAESVVSGQELTVTEGGSTMSREHKFSPPGEMRDYSWRELRQREINVADSDVESSGRDWKFISLQDDGEEHELLAVYINNPNTSIRNKSQLFWVADVSSEMELWGLAAMMALVERKRKSKSHLELVGTL